MTQIPLFPLNAVLFPNTPLPLHIFEKRYRMLVARCIAENLPFGVVYHRGEKMEQIGCSARIDRVLKRYADGRLDIVTVGSRRFAIESVNSSKPYLQALVRFLDESDGSDESACADLSAVAIDAVLRYSYYAAREIDREAMRDLSMTELSFLIAGIDEIGLETKQRLLELDVAETRLGESVEALEQVTQQLVTLMSLKKAIGDDVDLSTMKN